MQTAVFLFYQSLGVLNYSYIKRIFYLWYPFIKILVQVQKKRIE